MDKPPISIEITPEAQATLRAVQRLPQTTLEGIAKAMQYENDLTISYIQKEYMSFPKDGETVFPGLRAISGRLRGSLHAAKPEMAGESVTSGIGSNVVYAPVHEFGARITRKARKGSVRLRLDSRGNILKNFMTGKGAQFAKAQHKRVKEVAFESKETTFTIPARAPIQRGIEDRLSNYQESISKAIGEGWAK
jgi:phage gpG-like protein